MGSSPSGGSAAEYVYIHLHDSHAVTWRQRGEDGSRRAYCAGPGRRLTCIAPSPQEWVGGCGGVLGPPDCPRSRRGLRSVGAVQGRVAIAERRPRRGRPGRAWPGADAGAGEGSRVGDVPVFLPRPAESGVIFALVSSSSPRVSEWSWGRDGRSRVGQPGLPRRGPCRGSGYMMMDRELAPPGLDSRSAGARPFNLLRPPVTRVSASGTQVTV